MVARFQFSRCLGIIERRLITKKGNVDDAVRIESKIRLDCCWNGQSWRVTERNTYLGKKCKFLLLKPQQTNKRCFVMQQHLDSSSSVDISFSLAICILIVHLRVSIIIFCRVHFEWWWPSLLYHFFVFGSFDPFFTWNQGFSTCFTRDATRLWQLFRY